MERELCLVLDTLGKYRLVLKSGNSYEIDEYTSKNFEDSSQIRKKYKKEIDEFLNKYKPSLQKSNRPDYEGRIVIVIPKNVGMDMNLYQRQVLYKKHIVAFKKIIQDKNIMIKFVDYERFRRGTEKLVSDFFCTMIRRPWNTTITRNIKRWAKEEKDKKENYYEIIRDMLNVYYQEMQNNDKLPTVEKIYTTYLNEKKEQNSKAVENFVEKPEVSNEEYYVIDDVVYTSEEVHKFIDLDDIIDYINKGKIKKDSSYIPDGAKKK